MDRKEEAQDQGATTISDGLTNLTGRIIADKYRIEAKLGAGGMGFVYRATRLLIGDEVAIKILHSGVTDPKAGDRFQREARAAARLKHPNVVTIHDFGITDDGMQYLVMELVEGESLRHIIQQQGVIVPSIAVEITRQVCDALDDAHQHNVIHRDIKPDNIVVKATVNGLRVKVLDFGIAKLRDDLAGNLTQTGSILGTPHYMSPEQCLGEELDSRSDIYSLGIVVYEMLTGTVPFHAPSSSAVVVQHVTQPPPALRSINPAISPAIEFVVLNSLNKQREARPQTAGSLARNLSSALSHAGFPAPGQVNTTPSAPGLTDSSEATVVIAKPEHAVDAKPRRSRAVPILGYLGLLIGALVLGGAIVWFISSRIKNPENSPAAQGTQPLNISATASSTRLPIQTNTYDAPNAIDGRRNTAWVEGANGPGTGEWIRFGFDREIIVRRIIIQPGYFKSNQIWTQNNRLAAVTAYFSDGTSREISFTDSMESQQTALGIRTSFVRLVITSVYQGTNPGPYDDTGLSEITFEWEPVNTSN